MTSFELARLQGADGVEFDVQLSSDGVPMVIHDARLERTTSGSGWVWEHRASVLRRLDAGSWFNRRHPLRARERYAGARIPLLAEALAWAKARQCLAFVEVKQPGPEVSERVRREIEHAGAWDWVRVVSFEAATLEQARRWDAPAHLGLNFSAQLGAIARARALGAELLLPHWVLASRRFIRRAHRYSLPVIPWTVNSTLHMRRKILDGADGLVTNFPARLTAVLERLAAKGEANA